MVALGVSLEVEPVSLLIHVGLFLVALTVMTRFLLKPMQRVLAERAEAIVARQARAEALQAEAGQLERAYQERIVTVVHEARETKEVLRREGFAQAATLMEEARGQATRQLESARQELHEAAAQAKAVLQADARQFGRVIAERVLERAVNAREEMRRDNTPNETVARKANS